MAVRYKHEFDSLKGVRWKLEIDDQNYLGSELEFSASGFTLERNATNTNRNAPILGSRVVVHVQVEDTTFESMLSAMLGADEDRFFLKVYKDGALEWVGVLLMDMLEEKDMYFPYQCDLVFTDGIARLKDIDYASSGSPYSGTDTFVAHLNKIFSKIPTNIFWTGNDLMLKTSVHYFADEAVYSVNTDPLTTHKISHKSFYETKKNGEIRFMNCYDVLQQIAGNFFCRFFMAGGAFHMVQVDEFRNASIKLFEYRNGDTAYYSTSTLSPRATVDGTDIARLADGVIQRFAGLQKVKVIYQHQTSGNFAPEPIILNAAVVSLGNIDDDGGDARLAVKGTINLTVALTTTTFIKVRVRLKIKHGSYYLKRTAGSASDNNNFSDAEWTTTSTDTVEFWTTQITSLNQSGNVTINRSINVAFATPYLVTAGDLEVELISLTTSDVYDLSGTAVTSGVTLSGDLVSYIEYQTDDGAENEREFDADNTGLGNYSEILELPTAVFGDRINSGTVNKIEAYNGTTWEDATAWKKKNTGTAQTFHKLLCEDILSGQRTAILKYMTTIRGDVNFLNTLNNNGDILVFLSGTFNAMNDEWQCEIFKIGYDNSGIVTSGTGLDIDADLPPSLQINSGNGSLLDGTVELKGSKVDIADGNDNIQIGSGDLGGTGNINIGGGLGESATGNYNITSGMSAGAAITSGGYNVIFGYQAGKSLTSANFNNFFGYQAGYSVTTAVGGNYFGFLAGYSTTTGESNNFMGRWAGYSNTTGLINNYIGYQAGYSGTTAQYNNCLGYQTGYDFTSARYNNFIGYRSGRGTTSGHHNNFMGYDTGYSNTTAYYNIAIGFKAAYTNTTSRYNVAIGYQANYSGTGEYSIAIGADTNTATYNNSFVLGRGATATASNQFVVGSSTYNLGTFTNETVTSDYTITVRWNGKNFKLLAYAI